MANISQKLKWAGIILILATGLIHGVEAPEAFDEIMYKGILFSLNAVGALIAAFGIRQNKKGLGWGLGFAVAAGSFIGYVLSRTVGLPGLPPEPDAWFEPLGVASLVVEGLFVVVFLKAIRLK